MAAMRVIQSRVDRLGTKIMRSSVGRTMAHVAIVITAHEMAGKSQRIGIRLIVLATVVSVCQSYAMRFITSLSHDWMVWVVHGAVLRSDGISGRQSSPTTTLN